MNNNEQYNKRSETQGKIVGLISTIAIHLLLLFIFLSISFNARQVSPLQQEVLIDFEELEIEKPKPIDVKSNIEPKVKRDYINEDIKLSQKSQGTEIGKKLNEGKETTIGEDGDIEKPEPPRKKEIDQRAIFSSNENNNKDTLSPQTSDKIQNALKSGHPDGNTAIGNTSNTPQARLEGRTIKGSLPIPEYTVNKSGRVVVTIKVDQYGKVISATPGTSGTTVQDKVLWEAARKAALKAQFNISSTAAVVQTGTITYIFKLN